MEGASRDKTCISFQLDRYSQFQIKGQNWLFYGLINFIFHRELQYRVRMDTNLIMNLNSCQARLVWYTIHPITLHKIVRGLWGLWWEVGRGWEGLLRACIYFNLIMELIFTIIRKNVCKIPIKFLPSRHFFPSAPSMYPSVRFKLVSVQ